jgi:hypothetical protein
MLLYSLLINKKTRQNSISDAFAAAWCLLIKSSAQSDSGVSALQYLKTFTALSNNALS